MRFLSAVVVGSLVAASAAQAQGAAATSQCTGVAGDACQQAVDYFRYLAPQIGTAFTGGNTTLGQGGALGWKTLPPIPHFAIGVRVNAVLGNFPTFAPTAQLPAAGTPARKQLTTTNGIVPMPSVDVAVGAFKGLPVGVTTVGAVDVLLNAVFVPTINNDDINLAPDKSTSFGYGLRVGLIQESLVAPGVGVSFLSRKFPTTTISKTGAGSSMSVNDFELKSFAWRLTVSKSLLLFGLSAGVGQDKYDTSIRQISATMSSVTVNTPALSSEVTRTNYFADLSMNMVVLKLFAGGGMVSGGDVPTYNTYDNAPNKARVYGTVGVRFGL